MYKVILSKSAQKDLINLKAINLSKKAKTLIDLMAVDPFVNPPSYEKLLGNLQGFYSRRINIQHRLVYEVDKTEKYIKILRMWSHYE